MISSTCPLYQAEDSAAREEARTISKSQVARRTAEIAESSARIALAETTETIERRIASEDTEAGPDQETGETNDEEAETRQFVFA